MKNISVTVKQNEEVAPHCFRLVLSGPLDDFHLQPGQFVMLKVGKGCDPLLRRPFAAFRNTKNTEAFLEIYYQVVGRGTRLMAQMLPGDTLELLGPLGNGFTIPPGIQTALLVAGGMGIVPLRGLVHYFTRVQTVQLNLFSGAQSADSLLFLEEFANIVTTIQVSTEDGSLGHRGLITDLFRQFLEKDLDCDRGKSHCFACGPWSMLHAVAHTVSHAGIGCQVSLESPMACGVGACLGCVVRRRATRHPRETSTEYARVCQDGPVFDAQEIVW
jgi:dihydroorotate dehydrogenase electron transfer subunit